MAGKTMYSGKVAGEDGNYRQAVQFDTTDREWLGITAFVGDTDTVKDRVLLSRRQVKELLKWCGAHHGR